MVRPPDPEYVGFLAALDSPVRDLALAARATVLDQAPEALELAYDSYNAVALAFTFTGRLKEAFAHVAAYARHVNLGFNQGAMLPDPQGRLRGTGKAIRHVRLTAPEELADQAIRELLDAAVTRAGRPASAPTAVLSSPPASGPQRGPASVE